MQTGRLRLFELAVCITCVCVCVCVRRMAQQGSVFASHITGSTAVPNLPAMPDIFIQAACPLHPKPTTHPSHLDQEGDHISEPHRSAHGYCTHTHTHTHRSNIIPSGSKCDSSIYFTYKILLRISTVTLEFLFRQ